MLIKKMSGNTDFDRALHKRMLMAAGMLCVGLVGFACYFLLVRGSGLEDYTRGFYLGGASGITFGALGLLLYIRYLQTHPDARRRARIVEQDERQQMINNHAMLFAGALTFFTSAAALFVVLPFSKAAYGALLGVMILYAISFGMAKVWLTRKV